MHPLPLKNGLPYSQLCRVKLICGHQTDFDSNAKKTWEELLKTQPKKKNNATVFRTKYTKGSEKIKAILKKHWHILQSDKNCTTLQGTPTGVLYGDSFLRPDLPPEPTQTFLTPIPNGNYKCGSCAQCNSTIKTSFFRHPHTGQKIPVRGIISCNTKGVIYLITCSCGKAYVGQTKDN